jgi:hypothetical protein
MTVKARLHRLELQALRRGAEAALAASPYRSQITVDMMIAEMRRACALSLEEWRQYHANIYADLDADEVAEADGIRLFCRAVLWPRP